MARPVGSKSTVPSKADLKHRNRVQMLQMDAAFEGLKEKWKTIEVDSEYIQISTMARLRRDMYDYLTPDITKDHRFEYKGLDLAHLVAETFLGIEQDAKIMFKDYNSYNCAVSNLEVVNG